jgi:hypothetical protein
MLLSLFYGEGAHRKSVPEVEQLVESRFAALALNRHSADTETVSESTAFKKYLVPSADNVESITVGFSLSATLVRVVNEGLIKPGWFPAPGDVRGGVGYGINYGNDTPYPLIGEADIGLAVAYLRRR